MIAGQNAGSTSTVVFLVHGTFAKASTWPDTDGPVANAIANALPDARIERFGWSGVNSHSERAEAGCALAACFDRAIRGGTNRIYAVGHSHGGNVILRALDRDDLARRVAGIAFLGTPFMSATERRTRPIVEGFSVAATPFLILFALLALALPLEALAGDMAVLAVAVVGGLAGGLGFSRIRDFVERWLNNRIEKAGPALLELARSPLPACPVLVMTTPWDEAGHGLSLLDRLAASPWWLVGRMAAAIGSLIVGAFICSLLAAAFGLAEDGPAHTFVGTMYVAVFTGLALLAVPLAVVAGLVRRVSFGGESAIAAIAVRIVPQLLPPWTDLPGSSREVFRPPTAGWRMWLARRLHHSFFYEDQRVLGRVASWLAEIDALAARPEPWARAEPLPAQADDIPVGWYVLPGLALILSLVLLAAAEMN